MTAMELLSASNLHSLIRSRDRGAWFHVQKHCI